MKSGIEKFLRTFVIPIGATVLAWFYWRQYECQQVWWWLALIGAILATHVFFYIWKMKKSA
jgi:type VI protein secretion system component VasK